MITDLLYLALRVLISLVLKAYAMPIVMRIVTTRNWLYMVFASEEGKAHSEEILANLCDEIDDYRTEGDSNDVIATKIFLRLVTGLPGDIAWCAPFIPAILTNKVGHWSDALRCFKTPTLMIPSLGAIGIMNWAFFSSDGSRTLTHWFYMNSAVITAIVLMWNRHRLWARHAINALMGLGTLTMIALVAWLTVKYHLYGLPVFQAYFLAFATTSPVILVADKSWRADFKKHWLLATTGWVLMILVALAGSMVLTGSIAPLLTAWEMMAILAGSLFMLCVIISLAVSAIWYGAIKGSAAGLRLMAAGIRRLQ